MCIICIMMGVVLYLGESLGDGKDPAVGRHPTRDPGTKHVSLGAFARGEINTPL